jgi:hypothetical protein
MGYDKGVLMKPSQLVHRSRPLERGILVGAVVLVAAFVAAGCGGTKTVTKTVTVASTPKTGFGPPTELVEFGHIKSLKRKANGYEMRFDPAWYLSGVTANTAAAEDGAVPPGQPVPNDNYRLDEGHRLLMYLVPEDAHVTVLTRHGEGSLGETTIPVSELVNIVNGGQHRPLFEPLTTGVWIRYHIDTVRSIDQQYQP